MKYLTRSKVIDVWTSLEPLLGTKLGGTTHTPTEASNLIDEFYKKVEIQTEQHYRNALDKFIN